MLVCFWLIFEGSVGFTVQFYTINNGIEEMTLFVMYSSQVHDDYKKKLTSKLEN